MIRPSTVKATRGKWDALRGVLDERGRRRWAAVEARALGRGGVQVVVKATGLSRSTVQRGLVELDLPADAEVLAGTTRTRHPGAGRKPLTETDSGLGEALERLVEPTTRGDPMSPLRWTCKSTRQLANQLTGQGHAVSHAKVGQLLADLGYSLQGNRKTKEGASHADRNKQFEFINARVQDFQTRGQPVISVDTKKKELVGDFKNVGREWQPQGQPVPVRTHDFLDEELGKAIPYGVYDQTQNNGWVSVGIDHDTAEFAVHTIHEWWRQMGALTYPAATELLITADSGGSNSSRVRLWKLALQELADKTGLTVSVCHFPPGTSKWNKIEHRMFCHITRNWRGRPLESVETIVNLIANTTTAQGLHINASLDPGEYAKGKKVTDEELEAVRLVRNSFHGEWNYCVCPHHVGDDS
jgi:hypothetical protein